MFKLTDRLYIGNKADINTAISGEYNVIFLSPWDALDMYENFNVNKILSDNKSQRALFEIINEEMPHYKVEVFNNIIDLIDEYQKTKETVIISEHAQSRAPSFGLLFMACKAKKISNSSFGAARLDFLHLYPGYIPWPGMVIFLNQEWDVLTGNKSLLTKSQIV